MPASPFQHALNQVNAKLTIRIKYRIDDPKLIDQWESKKESLRGRHKVSPYELFTPEYILRESNLNGFDDFVAEAKLRDEIRSVDDMTSEERLAWDLFIRSRTRFSGWPELFSDASSEWLTRQIRGDKTQAMSPPLSPSSDPPTESTDTKQPPTSDDFATQIMQRLAASDPLAFQFAQWIKLELKPVPSQTRWDQWFGSKPRYEPSTDGRVFYYDANESLFQEVESLIYHLRKDPAFLEWKKQQPPPPPSIRPAPGTPEAIIAEQETQIAFMRKAGATEEEISTFQ